MYTQHDTAPRSRVHYRSYNNNKGSSRHVVVHTHSDDDDDGSERAASSSGSSSSAKVKEALSLFADVRARVAAATLHTDVAPPPVSSSSARLPAAAAAAARGVNDNDDDNTSSSSTERLLREQLRGSNALVQRLYERNKALARRVTQLEHACATQRPCNDHTCSSSSTTTATDAGGGCGEVTVTRRGMRDVSCGDDDDRRRSRAVGVQADALAHVQSCLRDLQTRFDALLRVQLAAIVQGADDSSHATSSRTQTTSRRRTASTTTTTTTALVNAEVSKLFAVMRDTIAAQAAQHEQERARMNAAMYDLERQLASRASSS